MHSCKAVVLEVTRAGARFLRSFVTSKREFELRFGLIVEVSDWNKLWKDFAMFFFRGYTTHLS
jgi:hypothetical protein